ncbi:MAG: hypothetical protein ACKPJJ_35340, partial [Planctomycetaceae bacterium]
WLLLCLRCSEQAVGGQSLSQTRHFDVIVGSCSPTGVAAAVAASSRGCSVLLTDSAEVPASPHSQSPGITFLHQSRITAVYRSPDSRRITAVSVHTHYTPGTSTTPTLRTFTCGFVIDASDAGELLALCDDIRQTGWSPDSLVSESSLSGFAQRGSSVLTGDAADFPTASFL